MSDRLRGACGIAAMAVVVVGASARSHLSMSITRGSSKSVASGIAGGVLLAAGLVIVIVLGASAALERRRGKRRSGETARRRPWLQALAMFVIVFGAVLVRRAASSHHAVEDTATPRTPAPQTPLRTPGSDGSNGGVSVAALVTAIVILAVCAAAVWWRRRKRQHRPFETGGAADVLQQALRDGTAAMHDVADARQVIIACYVAMRGTLQAAGIAVRASDTATQMLARASGAQLNLPAAERLTELFLEARFSAHSVGDDARAAAIQALNELQYRQPATANGLPL